MSGKTLVTFCSLTFITRWNGYRTRSERHQGQERRLPMRLRPQLSNTGGIKQLYVTSFRRIVYVLADKVIYGPDVSKTGI